MSDDHQNQISLENSSNQTGTSQTEEPQTSKGLHQLHQPLGQGEGQGQQGSEVKEKRNFEESLETNSTPLDTKRVRLNEDKEKANEENKAELASGQAQNLNDPTNTSISSSSDKPNNPNPSPSPSPSPSAPPSAPAVPNNVPLGFPPAPLPFDFHTLYAQFYAQYSYSGQYTPEWAAYYAQQSAQAALSGQGPLPLPPPPSPHPHGPGMMNFHGHNMNMFMPQAHHPGMGMIHPSHAAQQALHQAQAQLQAVQAKIRQEPLEQISDAKRMFLEEKNKKALEAAAQAAQAAQAAVSNPSALNNSSSNSSANDNLDPFANHEDDNEPVVSLSHDPPCSMLFIRPIGPEVEEREILEIFQTFGPVLKVNINRTKEMGMVTMEKLDHAIKCMNFYFQAGTGPLVGGRRIVVKYSKHPVPPAPVPLGINGVPPQGMVPMGFPQGFPGQIPPSMVAANSPANASALASASASATSTTPSSSAPPGSNKILLMTFTTQYDVAPIIPHLHPDYLHQLLSPYGSVHKVVILNKEGLLQALVQLPNNEVAGSIYEALNQKVVWLGPYNVLLSLQYSKIAELNIKVQGMRSRDFLLSPAQPIPGNAQTQQAS